MKHETDLEEICAADFCIRLGTATLKHDDKYCYIIDMPIGYYCPYREACSDYSGLTPCRYQEGDNFGKQQ